MHFARRCRCAINQNEELRRLHLGGGTGIECLVSFLRDNEIEIKGIIEPESTFKQTYEFLNVPSYNPSEFASLQINKDNAFVIVFSEKFFGIEQTAILQALFHAGIDKIFAVPEKERYNIMGTRVPFIEYFQNHIPELENVHSLLADDESKSIMEEYIRAIVEYDTYRLPQSHGRNKYFYSGSSVNQRKEIYTHLDNEVWINCGSNVGDSIFLFFDNGLKAEKIYAYEGDPKAYETLCSSLEYLTPEFREKIVPVNEFISEGTRFAEYIKEPVTLVNADIQGNELAMLHALENIVLKDRPVLAISIYHLNEDMVMIPDYLTGILNNYKYVLRKYASEAKDRTQTYELVLYAIPEERYFL